VDEVGGRAGSAVLTTAVARAQRELPGVQVLAVAFPASTPSVRDALDDLLDDCPSFGRSTASLADRTLIVALSEGSNGESYTFWGAAYSRLDDDAITGALDDAFEQGDGPALAAALDKAVDLQTATSHAGRTLAIGAGVVGGVVVLAGAGLGGVQWRRTRRRTATARAAAREAEEQASLAFVALEERHDQALLGVDALLGAMDEASEDDDPLRALRAEVESASSAALDAWASKKQALDEAPQPVEGMSSFEADRAAAEWSALQEQITAAQAGLDAAAAKVTQLESLVAGLPTDLVAQQARVSEVRAVVDQAAASGWQVAAFRATLDQALARLGEAEAAVTARRPVTAGRLRDTSRDAITQVDTEVQHLGERRDAVLARAGALEQALPAASARAAAAAGTLADLATRYVSADIDDIAGHAREATAQLAAATAAVTEVRRRAGMDVQDFAGAETTAAAAEQATTAAGELLGAVEERHARLDRLRAELPSRAAGAVEQAGAVVALVSSVGADADPSAAGRVRDAQGSVIEVQTGLSRLPTEAATEAGTSALSLDERLTAAEQALRAVEQEVTAAHQEAERARSAAQAAVDRAERALAAAEQQISAGDGLLWGSSVGDSARSGAADAGHQLSAARQDLARALQPGNAALAREVERSADAATATAEQAYASAAADIQAARERAAAQRRRRSYSGGGFGGGFRGGSSHRSSGGGGGHRRGGGGHRR
jgi:hypothetical protein